VSVDVLISEGALRHNLETLRSKVAPAELMFVVKSNGYGHDILAVSRIAESAGIKWLGVLEIPAALELRSVIRSPDVNILVWQFDKFDSLEEVADKNIELGVGDFAQLSQLSSYSNVKVHLKIDTGLNRNGVREDDWKRFVEEALALERKGAISVVAVWSHLAETSDEQDDEARSRFEEALSWAESRFSRKLMSHLSASSASFRRPEFRFDMIRNGGHVYGIPSFDGTTPKDMDLIPVMTLVSRVSQVDQVSNNQVRLTVQAGYTHGIPGLAAGKTEVAIRGQRYSVTEVLAESMIVIGATAADVGEIVHIFGDGSHGEQTVREWGDAIGTLGDEICCRINPSLKRIVVE
jgi:alanine racemase